MVLYPADSELFVPLETDWLFDWPVVCPTLVPVVCPKLSLMERLPPWDCPTEWDWLTFCPWEML